MKRARLQAASRSAAALAAPPGLRAAARLASLQGAPRDRAADAAAAGVRS
ncbi:hypothetical protein WME89_37695 [Sorangium sp. So ce321]